MSSSPEWGFFAAVRRAAPARALCWWTGLILRGVLPPLLGITVGWLVNEIEHGRGLGAPLTVFGLLFVAAQVVGPLHEAVGYSLGERVSTYLHDRLMEVTTSPAGIAHLERPDLIGDLTMARDFDIGMTGPPVSYSMNFISDGLVLIVTGVSSAVVLATLGWWQAILLVAAWSSTHVLLRESAVWHDRNTPEVQRAQRHAEYSYRLAVDPPAAKELRLFGLGDWIVDRFRAQRRVLGDLQFEATRLRERSTIVCLLALVASNVLVFWSLAERAADGGLGLGAALIATQAAVGVSGIAFGGLGWALDGMAAPVAAISRLSASMGEAGRLPSGVGGTATPARGRGPELRFRNVSFGYPDGPLVLDGLDLTVPAGTSLAIVGQNGAGKTTLAKLICRFYDPTSGAVEVDGTDLRDLDLDVWRRHVTAVFQDFVRYHFTLRDNLAPGGGVSDGELEAALADAGGSGVASLDRILATGYPGGTDLSGGQWQRVALARALSAVRRGAGVVLLDEPTAQLDVRGEAEIFERVLAATRGRTTVLVSHRFSTVRQADRICVLEQGRVVELGTHDELIALDGRYRRMFDLQASRFVEVDEQTGEEVVLDELA
ncbi:ABC transporter ATP-binding protein [Desertimonas flava]|uniref:ABC transporter ATP-binding protein n=1 Tax=Desertimonas flava TaxID=2064846 RepID=UPI000E356910|nr:ABC transporter ATP-binding protein [Desertimonas flava]